MHYPVCFHLGSASISAHLVFELLSYTVGYQLYVWQRSKTADRISDEHRVWIFIGAAAGAFLGSHLMGVLERPDEWSEFSFIYFISNKTVLGGFLGGLIGVELTKKVIGVTASSGDLMTYPILAGLFIGRIGCHLAGLEDGTHGLPSALPWAMDFGDGILRHPVNLYEMAFLAALAGFIYLSDHRGGGLPDGMRFKLFMIGYLIWRFAADWLKPVYFWPIGLTTIQIGCVLGWVYYGLDYLKNRRTS
jgi:prolipoprotein diacylglyceryltransferase